MKRRRGVLWENRAAGQEGKLRLLPRTRFQEERADPRLYEEHRGMSRQMLSRQEFAFQAKRIYSRIVCTALSDLVGFPRNPNNAISMATSFRLKVIDE